MVSRRLLLALTGAALLLLLPPRIAKAATTTWNPGDKTSNCTLSGANLIATTSGAGGVRSIDSQSSGKYYWEYTYTTINTNSIGPGIALSTASLTISSNTGIAYVARSSGGIVVNGTVGATLGIIAQGSTLGFAVDFTAQLLWVRVGAAGNWNASGTANPATGAGGISIAPISTGPLYAFTSGSTSDVMTANFGNSAFSGAVPSGFTSGFSALQPPSSNNLSLGIN